MNKVETYKNYQGADPGLLNLNNIMLEQAEISDHSSLVKAILPQLSILLKPVVAIYSEYDSDKKVLRIKETKVNQKVLESILKIGGNKLFSTETIVDEKMYKKITSERVDVLHNLHEVSNGSIPKVVSKAIGKTLDIGCYIGLSFMVGTQLYSTAIIALKEEPDYATLQLLKTYAYFTSMLLKRVLTEETLYKSEKKYEILFSAMNQLIDNIPDIIFYKDIDGVYLGCNIEFTKHLGLNKEEIIGKTDYDLYPTTEAEFFRLHDQKAIEQNSPRHNEGWITYRDGRKVFIDTIKTPYRGPDGQLSGVLGVSRDITERKQVEEQIRHIGFHDKLTNLYNRHFFEQCLEELKGTPVLSVIMTDVNGLKLINDTYGHEVGDELLKKYAAILKKSFKQSDLLFRWGGDEFIVILKNTKEANSWELCERLYKHCGETFVKDIPLSISVGISSKLQGEEITDAIKEAEDMMYKNKLHESKSSKNLIMKTLLEALSEKSFETKEHLERMSVIGREVGTRLSLPPSELTRLETLIMLHDIGKINIDSHILMKDSSLSEEEWQEIKTHPEVGYRITRTAEEFAYVAEEILAHHEKWDGSGYPRGLHGENIPYLARILSLLDSYDVMSNGRPYKDKMTLEEIIAEIENCAGTQFDPRLAREFVAILRILQPNLPHHRY